MKYSLLSLKISTAALGFMLLSFAFPPDSLDGLWKADFVVTYDESDSTVSLAKMLLKIDNNNFTIVNYDNLFIDNKPFVNSGLIDKELNVLVFNKDSINEKKVKFHITVNNHLNIVTDNIPGSKMVFGKLKTYKLGHLKNAMKSSFLNSNWIFEFTYFDTPLEMEFHPDKTFTVVNTVKPYFPVFTKWDIIEYDDELFVYFSGMAPFVQITNFENGKYECTDEFDKVYTGKFIKTKNEIKFDRELLIGIWEQKNPVKIDFEKIPYKLRTRDFYPKQVWTFNDSIATKYEDFRISDSPWEISRNGEMISFIAFNSNSYRHFRILHLDKKELIVERYYGDLGIKQDTLLRQKKMPKPTTAVEYFKQKR